MEGVQTMHKKVSLVLISLLVTALALTACGTAATPPFAQAGHWEGPSGVSFDVTEDGMVENFHILIVGECDVTISGSYPIDADHVLLIGEVDEDNIPIDNSFLGTFDTPTTVSGSFSTPWKCGTTTAYTALYLPTDLAVWSAEYVGE